MGGSNTSDIFIPSVFIAESAGQLLKDYYDYQNG